MQGTLALQVVLGNRGKKGRRERGRKRGRKREKGCQAQHNKKVYLAKDLFAVEREHALSGHCAMFKLLRMWEVVSARGGGVTEREREEREPKKKRPTTAETKVFFSTFFPL